MCVCVLLTSAETYASRKENIRSKKKSIKRGKKEREREREGSNILLGGNIEIGNS